MGIGWMRATVGGLFLAACGSEPAPIEGHEEATTTGAPPAPEVDASSTGDRDRHGHDGSSEDTAADPVSEDGTTGEVVEPGLGPPYPIVLSHGFFGFDDFAGVGFVDYFWRVVDHLEDEGETLVFTPAVDPFNDSMTRGEQLLAHVEAILAETGHAKVNIIGHSQGGLDARVVASLRPDLVASVTTFATPHAGTRIADIVLGLVDDPDAGAIVDVLVQLIGAPLWDEVGEETSVMQSLEQLSEAGMVAFNEVVTDQPGVRYFSLTGRTAYHLGGSACAVGSAPDFVTDFGSTRDPVDPLLSLTQAILAGPNPFALVPNDGLVTVDSARWGTFLGCLPADHLDEIGHLFGTSPGLFNDWKYMTFYADLVAFLRDEGL